MSESRTKSKTRRRSSSVTDALKQVPLNQQEPEGSSRSSSPTEVKPLSPGRPRVKRNPDDLPDFYKTRGFWDDVKTGRWTLIPESALKLMLIPAALYWNQRFLVDFGILKPSTPNPFEPLIFLSGRLPNGKYTKAWADIAFILYYIIFWSFVRQFLIIYVLRPMAKAFGIRGSKIMRFTEQGYAVIYMGIAGSWGIYVMRGLPTWWYRTERLWLGYPHKEMTIEHKVYYLMQASYWMQQTVILAAKIEKPRKDFKELVAHHLVSLWMICWSYGIYLTYIGICIFVTMDVSDVFLALAKCINYINEDWSTPGFACFVFVWTYARHYLNIKILWSVYKEFDLIPEHERNKFSPLEDRWLDWWMKWQILAALSLLQLINLFWWFLIMRILLRSLFSKAQPRDERSDDEDGEGPEPSTEEKLEALKVKKAE